MAYAGANGRLTAAPQELLSVAAAPFLSLIHIYLPLVEEIQAE